MIYAKRRQRLQRGGRVVMLMSRPHHQRFFWGGAGAGWARRATRQAQCRRTRGDVAQEFATFHCFSFLVEHRGREGILIQFDLGGFLFSAGYQSR